MSNNDKQKALNFLEDIQRSLLYNYFGENYEYEFLKFRSATKNIEKYIELQPSLTEKEKKDIRKYYQKAKDAFKPQTKFDNFTSTAIIQSLFKTIQSTAEKLSLAPVNMPIIGTALTKTYNAYALKVPGMEEWLILFEEDLIVLSNQLAKLIALSLPDFRIADNNIYFSFAKDRIQNHIQKSDQLQKLFADLIFNVAYFGEPRKTQKYHVDELFTKLQYELLNSLELFIVGHEYAHIALGHLNTSDSIIKSNKFTTYQKIVPQWEKEYEADLIGTLLLLHSIDKNDGLFPFCLLGPELFFTFLDIDERANNLISEGKESHSDGSKDHPPTVDRRYRVRQAIKSALSESQEYLEAYECASEFLEDVIELLWQNFKSNHAKE